MWSVRTAKEQRCAGEKRTLQMFDGAGRTQHQYTRECVCRVFHPHSELNSSPLSLTRVLGAVLCTVPGFSRSVPALGADAEGKAEGGIPGIDAPRAVRNESPEQGRPRAGEQRWRGAGGDRGQGYGGPSHSVARYRFPRCFSFLPCQRPPLDRCFSLGCPFWLVHGTVSPL